MGDTKHFFIEIKKTNKGFSIEKGILSIVNSFKHRKKYFTQSDEAFEAILFKALKDSGKQDVLIFIHGVWAYGRPLAYHLTQFDEHLIQKADSNIGFTLTIIWHTPIPSYIRSRRLCRQLALVFAPTFWQTMDNLLKNKELRPRLHLLCHSMGNYLFENLLEEKPKNQEQVFEQILLVAADIDIDFFEKYTKDMKALTNRVVLLNNKNDVLLKVSRYLNRVKRLGIAPPQYFEDLQPFLSATEISQVRDVRNLIALSGQHIYYNASVKVLNYIKSLLEGGEVLEKIE